MPVAVIGFLYRDYSYRSIASQILPDSEFATISSTGRKVLRRDRNNSASMHNAFKNALIWIPPKKSLTYMHSAYKTKIYVLEEKWISFLLTKTVIASDLSV